MPSKSLISILIGFLVVAGICYLSFFDKKFAADAVLAKADRIAASDGCAEAIPLYDQAIQGYASAAAYESRAECLYSLRKYEAAKADFNEALRLEPGSYQSLYNRALTNIILNKSDEALADWAESSKVSPAKPAPHVQRAELLSDLGRFDEALREYDQALATGGDPDQIRLRHAELQREAGNYELAIAEYRALMNADNAGLSSTVQFEQAAVKLAQDDSASAQQIVDDGLKQWPDDAYGLYWRGILELFVQNQTDAAALDFAKSFARAEEYRMGRILLAAGSEALGVEKADGRSYYTYGKSYLPAAYETILYLDVARLRLGQDGAEELAKHFDSIAFQLRSPGSLFAARLVGWPTPIIQFYIHKITLADLMEWAKASPVRAALRVCAAEFFAGLVPDKDTESGESQRHLVAAAENCPAGAIEKTFAKLELRRRGL